MVPKQDNESGCCVPQSPGVVTEFTATAAGLTEDRHKKL
jgi:hypothetical protein